MPAALAPAGLAFALLVDLLEWILVYALIIVWAWTVGWLLLQIADRLRFRVHIPGLYTHTFDLGGPFRAVEQAVSVALHAEKVGLDIEIGWTWNQLRAIWHATALAVEAVARETDATFDWLERVKLPKWAKWIATAALPAGLLAKLIREALGHLWPQILKAVKALEHAIPHTITKIYRLGHAGALTLPKWVSHIPAEIRGLTRRLARIERRLAKLEGLFGVTAMAAAMANVFGLPNWRCLTRGNVGRTARALCGIPSHMLEDLLALVADFAVLSGICRVLPWLEAGVSEVAEPMVVALTEVGAGLCSPASSIAPPLPKITLYLPPTAASLTAGV